MGDDRRYARSLIGKVIVSKSGKRFGETSNMTFEVKTGELMHLVLKNPTALGEELNLERDNEGNILVPFSSIIAIGDYIVISEEDIL